MIAPYARRRPRFAVAISVASILVVGAACADLVAPARPLLVVPDPAPVEWASPDVPPADVPNGAVTGHVIIVSIDGLRPDAIARFHATTLVEMLRHGSHTLAATTINPSKTLPSHTSMLTGEGPEEHGITWNSNQTHEHATVEIPTIFALARERGLRTAAFFSKGKFNHLEVPGSLDYSQAPEGNGRWSADRTVSDVERYLASHRPNLLFVHLGEPDYSGHDWGWMSWYYGYAVRKADAAVARLLDAADGAYGAGRYTVIVTADHGGHGRTHGTTMPEDVTIPWIAWGAGVRSGTRIESAVRTMDTAGTALWLLGIDAPEGWSGVPVREAFTAPE